ncbi:Bug family tripartite tricarboxylate transporter substrate binding protein [Pseudorhodoferax soli]|uniref:Tripartite-type tricarboxylate transporter receptor subunit TctC n=1 Tax=Pseudorhodoferax soli TaxID=545864 RepID=A0A368Y1H8_9BURK|nr:tripartite tricarboxylate transporter substrate binding protein [Pseudorhodoferax soli]RCW74180.1 tripartite-type tricarboxylate transporter receptor subunit TctC [Pseudorhodoferax soli]
MNGALALHPVRHGLRRRFRDGLQRGLPVPSPLGPTSTKTSFKQLLCVLSLALSGLAGATDYPDKPVRIVVPYPPGGASDTVARLVGQQLAQRLGQPVLVENKPGATEQIGAGFVAKSKADGYTLLLASTAGLSVNPTLYKGRLAYDAQKDFAPLAMLVTLPSIVMVHPALPVRTFAELTAHLRAAPSAVSYASSGAGNPSHLGMELYKRLATLDLTHVPYKGGAPALQDLMSGQVQVMMAIGPESMPMATVGKLRALAVTTAKRSPAYPGLPTVAETPGFANFELLHWFGLLAPAGTPTAVVAQLNQRVNEILHDPAVKARLTELGMDIEGGPPQKLADTMQRDRLKWEKVITDANIRID